MERTGKNILKKFKYGILTSLAMGCAVIPFILFSGLAEKQPGTVDFFAPAVIAYTIVRTGLICLRGFGSIENPYRIMRNGLWIALAGAVVTLLSYRCRTLLPIGALISCVGYSPFAAMYVPLVSELAPKEPALAGAKYTGSLLFLIVTLLMLFLRKCALPAVQVLFLLYTAGALAVLQPLARFAPFNNAPAFDTSKRRYVYFMHGALVLLSLLVLRQYKSSGESALIFLAPLAAAFAIAVEMARRSQRLEFRFETYWSGAMRSFLLLYSLIYHVSVGNGSLFTYLALLLGAILEALIVKPLRKLLPGMSCARVCMLLSAVLSFLLAFPGKVVTFIGLLLSSTLAGVVSAESQKGYLMDERFDPKERALVRYRVYYAGGVLAQAMLFVALFFAGERRGRGNLLAAYSSGVPDTGIGSMLKTVCFVCCGVLLISAVLIAFCFARREKKQ